MLLAKVGMQISCDTVARFSNALVLEAIPPPRLTQLIILIGTADDEATYAILKVAQGRKPIGKILDDRHLPARLIL